MSFLKKVLFMSLSVMLLVFLLITTSYSDEHWWDKFGEPQYGGTINHWAPSLSEVTFDPAASIGGKYINAWGEPLFWYDITVDPNIHTYQREFVTAEYFRGLLAESWEQKDPRTVIVHLRKGVHWQNLDPLNGREFTAKDVEYTYYRILGVGHGFTKPIPGLARGVDGIERAVAKDKYTVEFVLKKSGYFYTMQIIDQDRVSMVAQEVVEKYGADFSDARNAVGTGPWIYEDYIDGVSLSFRKNPDYHGTDDRHPGNKIPYTDAVKILAIPDTATAIAAMRTGKLDLMFDLWGGLSTQQAIQLTKTNPNIKIAWLPSTGATVEFRCDREPFTDIRVRKALQMAINREAIAKSIYSGTVEPIPCGLVNPVQKEWCIPYDQWPSNLKEEYSYNPDKARTLLKEAGYPKGFKTNCVVASSDNLDLLQAIKAQFLDIGVDMEIKAMERYSFMAYVQSGKHDQMDFWDKCGNLGNPYAFILNSRDPDNPQNVVHNNDPVYKEMLKKLGDSADITEAKKLAKEADMYALQQHWAVNVFSVLKPGGYQSWLKGYNGEVVMGMTQFIARWWIDQDLKKSIVH